MALYNCLVIDDNIIERDAILMYLKKIKNLNILADFDNAMDAIDFINTNTVDLIFSDIDMPELSGIDMIKNIKNPPVFVFVTAHRNYAVESFEVNAVDFILKPISFDKIFTSVQKAIAYLELKRQASGQSNIISENNSDSFYIKENKGTTRLKYADVIYIESLGDFSSIYTLTDKHIVLVNLKNMESQLPENLFIRVHKSYIINFGHLTTIATSQLHLTNNHTTPVNLVARQELLKRIEAQTLVRANKTATSE